MLGLLFGSFDPIHNGHLKIARWALTQGCDEVWLMIQSENAYKSGLPFASLDDRVVMAGLAVAGSSQLKAVEVKGASPAHLILESVQDLKNSDPVLLLGADLSESFDHWPDAAAIANIAKVLSHPRFDTASSSVIRARIATQESIDDAVPTDVAEYIELKGLYQP